MFGAFIITTDNDVLFSQLGEHRTVKEFVLAKAYSLVTAVLDDGSEEHFTQPLTNETAHALAHASHVLLADVGADGSPIREYEVPVVIT